jgi:hypothetical protein
MDDPQQLALPQSATLGVATNHYSILPAVCTPVTFAATLCHIIAHSDLVVGANHDMILLSALFTPTALLPEDFALLQLYGAAFSMGEPVAKAVRAVRSKKGSEPVLADPAAASDVVMVAASALSAQVYPDSRWGEVLCVQYLRQ